MLVSSDEEGVAMSITEQRLDELTWEQRHDVYVFLAGWFERHDPAEYRKAAEAALAVVARQA